MKPSVFRGFVTACIVASLLMGASAGRAAQSIVDEWTSVQRPPAPELKAVSLDPQSTALLMLDFMNQNCGKRPRCIATLPSVKSLLTQARARNLLVVYTLISKTTTADVMKDVAPVSGEPSVLSGPDKFVNTDLERILKERGIKTVIAVGTSANGAVLYTASAAAFRGMKVVVPVDGMSSADSYADLVTAAVLMSAPRVAAATTLTKIDLIKF